MGLEDFEIVDVIGVLSVYGGGKGALLTGSASGFWGITFAAFGVYGGGGGLFTISGSFLPIGVNVKPLK